MENEKIYGWVTSVEALSRSLKSQFRDNGKCMTDKYNIRKICFEMQLYLERIESTLRTMEDDINENH